MVKEFIQRTRLLLKTALGRDLDGLELLQRDHLKIEAFFLQWRIMRSEEARKRIFSSLRTEVFAHLHLEEAAFYPSCEKLPNLKRAITECKNDHKQLKALFHELGEHPFMSDAAEVKMKILREELTLHFKKEENEIFPRFRMTAKKSQFERVSREIRANQHGKVEKEAA
ncbi:MAG: hemerythrin domain-containing protein [Bdellovibrionia bacterium]